jgi:hypothetical protein
VFERGERNSLENDEKERNLLVGHISKHKKRTFLVSMSSIK